MPVAPHREGTTERSTHFGALLSARGRITGFTGQSLLDLAMEPKPEFRNWLSSDWLLKEI